MTDINHVILIGRLTRDAELKYTAGGQAVCKFALAVNRRRKSGDQWVEEANFFDVVLWGRSGEALSQYLSKGKQVAIEGELRQERWEKDGQIRSRVEVNADNVQLLGGNAQGAAQNGQGSESPQPSSPDAPRQPSGSAKADDDGFTDDIPF